MLSLLFFMRQLQNRFYIFLINTHLPHNYFRFKYNDALDQFFANLNIATLVQDHISLKTPSNLVDERCRIPSRVTLVDLAVRNFPMSLTET